MYLQVHGKTKRTCSIRQMKIHIYEQGTHSNATSGRREGEVERERQLEQVEVDMDVNIEVNVARGTLKCQNKERFSSL